MPIYEYQCQKCEHQFETIQKISEAPLKRCPACRKLALKKLVSRAAFRLKGGGWYETDFKSGNKKNVAGGGDAPAKASDGGSGDAGSATKKGDGEKPAKASKEASKTNGATAAD